MITNNNNNRTRGRTLTELMPQSLVRRNLTEDPNLCAQMQLITIDGQNVLQNATSATVVAIGQLLYISDIGGHFKRDCPKLKNNNHGNQGEMETLQRKCMRSFVSIAFSSQIDITPSTLDHYYNVELADGRIIRLNTILRGCTLNFLNHPFNIDLMPVELGSLDVIIGMDWLAKYQAVIVCAEKIIRILWGNETLTVQGDGSDRGNETRLNIILCTKTQ
ncbi:putative reverse transcriptase domain-containing protein, partial [Tanacetum coccineum]